ncbi:MAG: outer membrane beta-barrel protein [Opitutales bacterium]|nr:outer membrane beta-barrel protein [Opitutales bacterium]
MKKLSLLASLAVMGASAYAAGPLLQIGDDLDVSFIGSVIGSWTNNVTWSSQKTYDDYRITTRLGGEAVYGKSKSFTVKAKAYEDLNRYTQHSRFDSNLANVYVNGVYQSDIFNAGAHFSFVQSAQNTETTVNDLPEGVLARTNNVKVGVNASYIVSNKLIVDAGFDYVYVHYTNMQNLYTDSTAYIVPVSLLYKITDKLSAGLSYMYRQTNYSDDNMSESKWASRWLYGDRTQDHFIGVTLRGEITSKLSTEIYLGATVRDTSDAQIDNDDTAFAFSAKFDYQISDKASVYVKGLRDFGNGAQRQNSLSTGVDVGVNYELSAYIKSYAFGGYRYSDYINSPAGRKDDKLFAGAGISYSPVSWASVSLGYTYYDNSSTMASASYMAHVASASLSIKY